MGQDFSHNVACEQIEADLGIKGPFLLANIEATDVSIQRVTCLIQQEWIAKQTRSKDVYAQNSTSGKQLSSEEKTSLLQPSPQYELNGWQRFNIVVIKKPLKKLRINQRDVHDVESYSLFDFLLHASNKDKADMEEFMIKRFKNGKPQKQPNCVYLDEDALGNLVKEICCMKLKQIKQESGSQSTASHLQRGENIPSTNISKSANQFHFVPLVLACHNDSFMYFIESTPSYTLHDVLAFSPSIASNSAAKYMFLFYQILQIFSTVEGNGFTISPSITFKDFHVRNSMLISISRFAVDESDIAPPERMEQSSNINSWLLDNPKLFTPPFLCLEDLQDYTTQWVNCELTTFDYLMILNTLAGRRMKDPAHHPIFPWVVDFTKADGGYRDFTKSKYRLCKSDAQLDITYNQPSSSRKDAVGSVSHHISDDPLTAITYYVYLSRRISKEILCRYVRARWVPDEYPSSMERLYSWTPEECIPEFYSDPTIFRSVHADLPDLRLPSWVESPEDFIKYHRAALEGQFVSQNLNHWVDLVFGYKLSGMASVDSKNVYLSLVDGHNYLTNCGVLQLFSRPHPSRKIQNLNEEQIAVVKTDDSVEDGESNSVFVNRNSDEANVDGIPCVDGQVLEDGVKSVRPSAIRRDIWSIDSAIDEASQIDERHKTEGAETEPRHKASVTLLPTGLRMRIDTLLEGTVVESKIALPDDLTINSKGCSNFISDLEAIEKELKFQCHIAPADSHGVGKFEFGSIFVTKNQGKIKSEREIESEGNRNILTLTNILIELALHEYARLRTRKLNAKERLHENMRLMRANLHRFPSWLLAVLECWLKSSDLTDDADDDFAVNRIFRHSDLLLNQFLNPFPHPKYFPSLHNLLSTLYLRTGSMYDSSAAIDRYNLNLVPKGDPIPSINNISRAAHLLPLLIEEVDKEGVYLLLSFLLPLFSNPDTKLYAFLHFFHPLGSVMGFHNSFKWFFVELQKLYDTGSELNPVESKLLDQIFISKVITVFGLNCFLECFIQYVIDGLVEKNGSEYSKEKNDSDNFDVESSEFQAEKPNDAYKESVNKGESEVSESKEPFKTEGQSLESESSAYRKDSFIDDEDNVNLFNPKPLSGKRLAQSGVFTRLESILEDGQFRGQSDTDESYFSEHEMPNNYDDDDIEPSVPLDLGTISEKKDDTNGHRFLRIVDKSEVIYSENGSNGIPRNEMSKKHSWEKTDSVTLVNANDSSSGWKGSEITTSNSIELLEKGGKKERRSTLSESVGNTSLTQSVDGSQKSNSNGAETSSSLDQNAQGSSLDDDLPVAIEDFSIDSMYSEDEGKSFLIRRSSVKIREQSGSSPFMVLHSDEDVSEREDPIDKVNEEAGFDEYTDLQFDRVPDGDALPDITEGVNNDETVQMDSSAEDLSLGSLKWIMPWLGPSLTAKYVVNLVLKKITKIWLSVKNIELVTTEEVIATWRSKGKFLINCLVEVIGIYGNAVVFHQFIPYASRAVSAGLKSNTVSTYVEGQLVASTQILTKTLVSLSSESLADKMEVLSQEVFEPLLRLLSSLKPFSSGSRVRSVMLHSLVGLLAVLSQKLGQLDARDVMSPLLQRFFSCFDCVYRLERKDGSSSVVVRKYSIFDAGDNDDDSLGPVGVDVSLDDGQTLESSVGGSSATMTDSLSANGVAESGPATNESHDIGAQSQTSLASVNSVESSQENAVHKSSKEDLGVKTLSDEVTNSESEANLNVANKGLGVENQAQTSVGAGITMNDKALNAVNQYKDMYNSFTPGLAHYSYVLFCRVLGDHFVSSILYNEDLIWQLCSNFDEGLTLTSNSETPLNDDMQSKDNKATTTVKRKEEDKVKESVTDPSKTFSRKRTISEHEEDAPVFWSTWQHIEGDWLKMWRERLDTKTDDGYLSFKGRRLQTYAGHSSAVRDIYIPDNEHYFLSASRDKTVKLWLLKNHGNGTAQIGCGKTYDKHTKPVFAIQSIESKRFAVSCDGTVHVWDPIKSATVSHVDLGKGHSIVNIRTLPAPNTTVAMASTEGTLRLYDVRQKSMCDEWKLVSNSAAGNVKCLCVNESGAWIAAGFSSGFISVLDLRTGILKGQWRAHESEILQMEAYNDHNFLSTSNDLRMKMWNEDGSLALRFKCPPEPVHCLTLYKDQCIWATTNGNRIGITHHIENWANYESKRLPQELFKGNVSKLKVLPVNQLYLVGSENGNVVMFD